MEFIEEWFLVYWKQPDHWIVSQNHCIFGWYLGFKTFYLSLKVVGDGWVVVGGPSNFIVNQSPNLCNFGFKTFDLDFGLDKKIFEWEKFTY